jgi:hypothetical protein
MPTTQQYRMKAAEYAALADRAPSPSEGREFRALEHSFAALAANQEWLAGDDHGTTASVTTDTARAEEEVLRCLGAAVVMRWQMLPTKIRRELLDRANSIRDLPPTTELRKQIAGFLPDHENDPHQWVAP